MVLFFDLDIREQLAQARIRKLKDIGIIFRGNHFLRTDTVRCKEAVVFLIIAQASGTAPLIPYPLLRRCISGIFQYSSAPVSVNL